jgi:xanthosine utilization system XapX-like protein
VSTLVIYLLLLGAGFLVGGAYSLWKINRLVAGGLAITAVLLATAAIIRIVG